MNERIQALLKYAVSVGWVVKDVTEDKVFLVPRTPQPNRANLVCVETTAPVTEGRMEGLWRAIRLQGVPELVEQMDHKADIAPPPGLRHSIAVPPGLSALSDEWVPIHEAAARVGKAMETLRSHVRSGRIPVRGPKPVRGTTDLREVHWPTLAAYYDPATVRERQNASAARARAAMAEQRAQGKHPKVKHPKVKRVTELPVAGSPTAGIEQMVLGAALAHMSGEAFIADLAVRVGNAAADAIVERLTDRLVDLILAELR